MREYFVYLMASPSRTLYVGVTNDLLRRVWEHKQGTQHGFTRRHGVTKLVYFEVTSDASAALAREKQLKRWPRHRKERLIEAYNAGWLDLGIDWFREGERRAGRGITHTPSPSNARPGCAPVRPTRDAH